MADDSPTRFRKKTTTSLRSHRDSRAENCPSYFRAKRVRASFSKLLRRSSFVLRPIASATSASALVTARLRVFLWTVKRKMSYQKVWLRSSTDGMWGQQGVNFSSTSITSRWCAYHIARHGARGGPHGRNGWWESRVESEMGSGDGGG